MTATTAPVTQPDLLARLMEAVEPAFRAEVFIPEADDPVFTFGRCRVPSCNRPLNHAKPGLCNGHRKAWRDAGEPPLEEWAGTQTRVNYGNVSFPACLVAGCNRAGGRIGLCPRHRHGWRSDGPPDPAEWAAGIAYIPPSHGERDCRFTGCERWADVTAGFCAGHYARWKKAGQPTDLEAFSRYSSSRGMPMLDMRDLSPQIRLELGLGLQRRAEAGDRKTCLRSLAFALTWIRETQVTSLLDLDDDAWRTQARGRRAPGRRTPR